MDEQRVREVRVTALQFASPFSANAAELVDAARMIEAYLLAPVAKKGES